MVDLGKESRQTKFYKSLGLHTYHPFFTWHSHLHRVALTSRRSSHHALGESLILAVFQARWLKSLGFTSGNARCGQYTT